MTNPLFTRRRRTVAAVVSIALLVAACGGDETEDTGSGLATLTDDTAVTETTAAPEQNDEEALLAFSDCMRENGVPDFQDPIINADGSIEFVPPPGAGDGTGPSPELTDAFEVCFPLLEGVALGPGGEDFDLTELQDDLLLLAECLRDNGLDADDPNILESFGGNQGDGPPRGLASLFGDGVDLTDPKVIGIIEDCAEKLDLAGPGGGPGPRQGDG
jgi:hypothetical protein